MIGITGKEYLLDAVLEYCEDIVTVKDLNLKYLAYNKALLKLIRKDTSFNAIGKSVFEVLSKENAEAMAEHVKKVLETLQTQTCMLSVKNDVENRIIKQTTTPIIQNGIVKGILSVSTDVTKEEKLRNIIVDKNRQMQTLLENLPILAYMKDKNLQLTVAADASRTFVEQGIDKFTPDVHVDMVQTAEETRNEDMFVLENKQLLVKEKSACGLNGKQHWYRVTKASILDEKNEADGIVTIAKNINDEKIAENQKSLFLATLSHDLKNPLQAQISSLELFYQGVFGSLTDTQKEMLEMIIESSKYMRTMLYSLLKTCKENNGVIYLEKKYFDIKKLLQKSIKEVTDLGLSKNIKIEFNTNLKDNDANFFGDEVQIRRVIGNLLNNGLNYAFSGTIIKVSLVISDDKLIMSFENKSDTITEDLAKHIFDKYVCGNSLQSNMNMGLGLYFCRKVVEAHEGSIRLEGDENDNKFIVELPILKENAVYIKEIVL